MDPLPDNSHPGFTTPSSPPQSSSAASSSMKDPTRAPSPVNTTISPEDSLSFQPPTTPGEDMVFDRGLLYASRPNPHSNGLHSAPLPPMPPMPRNNSYPEPGSHHPPAGSYMADSSPPQSHHPSEIRSAPLVLPQGAHPHHPPRTASPQRSMHHKPSNGALNSPPQSNLATFASNNSLHRQFNQANGRPYTPYSAPPALRPDSVCSFPDSSPLMAPNVLAAVDARLRESQRRRAAGSNSASPRSDQTGFDSTTARHSRASSYAPVITHHTVLQNSEAIQSREQLYDILNRDDDKEDSNEKLDRPKPEFFAGSTRSSRRNSTSSSYAHGSDIELNEKRSSFLGGSRSGASASMVGGPGTRMDAEKGSPALAAEYAETMVKVEKSPWLKSKNRNHRRWKGLCCVVGLLALMGAIAGITIGFISRKDKVDGLAPPHKPDDPAKPKPPITDFKPDPNLRKVFYGVDYNPAKSLMPWCGATLQAIVDDVILMSQITNRIRLYGMDCNQADLTFQAIKALKVPMEVVLTVWIDKDPATNKRQTEILYKVLDEYGTDMLTGVSVGNEVLFRKDQDLATLSTMMETVRVELKRRYNKNIPVFTSEVGSNMTPELAAASDMLQGNLHPYFSGSAAAKAANWTFTEYETKMGENPVASGAKGVISEVGWPSAPESAVYLNGSIPGLANMQTVVDSFVCQANKASIPYYWFEFRDEPWKINPEVPVEPYWGIFDKDAKLKIKLPDCLAP